MGKCAPVILAFLLNCFGVNIFRENTPGCEPLISSLIFLMAVSIILWDMKLYPSNLRKLSKHCSFMLEFFQSAFLMEHIMTAFWYPLEASLASFLPKVAEFEAEILKQGGWDCGGLFSFLQWDGTLVIASYIVSFFFLFVALHATRTVDFRLFRYGSSAFANDVVCRLKKLKKRLLKMVFNPRKNEVDMYVKYNCKGPKSIKAYQSSENMSACDETDDDGCYVPDDEEEYPYQKKF